MKGTGGRTSTEVTKRECLRDCEVNLNGTPFETHTVMSSEAVL